MVSHQVVTSAHVAGGAKGTSQTPATPAQAVAAAVAEVVRRQVATGARRASIVVTPTAAVVTSPTPLASGNLLANPGAEIGDPSLSGYSSVTMPGWQVTGTPTVIQYGTQRRLPGLFGTKGLLLPKFLSFPQKAPVGGETQFFGGGNVATASLTQTVDFGQDAGGLDFALSADLGGYLIDPSRASVKVNFLDANQGFISSAEIKPVTALGRLFQTGLETRSITGVIPDRAESAQVVVTLKDLNPVLGNYNNAYADNISFSVSQAFTKNVVTVPSLTSNVGTLDHVIMVYMENHGVGDIVGSPNAPYINSLINAYGYAQNYYALTHPSMPNYWPILGGTDFGLNYNCAAKCFTGNNLISDNPLLTWAGYQDGGGGYSDPQDRLPFMAFSNLFDEAGAHIFDIAQMATDFNGNPDDVAQFIWFAGDESTNMEGPISTLPSIVKWAVSQLTTNQYNVAAGDQFISDTVTTIFNSDLWTSNQSTAIFLTFDEDFNNISFGIGNEGNHVVMVVIPNQAAIDSGMKGGAFVASDYYNHYSLQRTIELALGLGNVTNNDLYAQPMNEFWV